MAARKTTDRRESAVVVGASMGGLSAAAALATCYQRVTVLDRDDLPEQAAHRKAVPQSKHAHGLQPGGVRALDELLPGLIDKLRADGVPIADVSAGCRWTVGGHTFDRTEAGAMGIGVSRPFLEQTIRCRVGALPGVIIRDSIEVEALISDRPGYVSGVAVRSLVDGKVEQISADLVVDACGKTSKLPQWLADLGYDEPDEESVVCKVAYLSRRWRLDPSLPNPDVAKVCTPAVEPHFGAMIEQEDGTYIVTLGGLLDNRPNASDEAYLAFARALPDNAIADALEGAVPVTELQRSHFPASRRRRYDRLRRLPAGVIALGDSIAAFNPMYGQGMSVAALEAVMLRRLIQRGPLDNRKYFAQAHKIADVAWKISTGGDLRFDGVQGRRTPDMKFMNRYLDRLTAGAVTDPALARRFLLVAGFLEGPESLFTPAVIRRVIWAGRHRRRAEEPARPNFVLPSAKSG